MDDFRMNHKGSYKMLENPTHDERYEFYTMPIQKSNIDTSIAYYEPRVKHCKLLIDGSTENDCLISITEGNKLYKKLLANGWVKVTFETQSFA